MILLVACIFGVLALLVGVLVCGSAFAFVFGDVIVFIGIIWLLRKLFKGKKSS